MQETASPMHRAPTSPFATPGRGETPGAKQARADARAALLATLPLLRHLAHDSPAAKSALADSRFLECLQAAWRAVVVVDGLALEALQLLAALLAESFDARHALCHIGRPPLLLRTIRVIFRYACLPCLPAFCTFARVPVVLFLHACLPCLPEFRKCARVPVCFFPVWPRSSARGEFVNTKSDFLPWYPVVCAGPASRPRCTRPRAKSVFCLDLAVFSAGPASRPPCTPPSAKSQSTSPPPSMALLTTYFVQARRRARGVRSRVPSLCSVLILLSSVQARRRACRARGRVPSGSQPGRRPRRRPRALAVLS